MIYRFADLQLDLGRRQLLRGETPLKLSRLSLDVLVTLVESAPALVSYDEIIDRAWGPNRVVTPENLAQRMSLLRNGLGDDASDPRYIEGVRGEGFRLIPTVEQVEPERTHDRQSSTHWRMASVASVFVAVLALGIFILGDHSPPVPEQGVQSSPSRKAIAVLPFANLSPDIDNAYYAAGIHEEVLNRLAKLKELQVISRTSVLNYSDSPLGIREIAQDLAVDAVIEGSVRYSNDRIRVTVQLVDGSTDQHLWSETYDRQFDDIFAIESDIAEKVAQAMMVTYSDSERRLLETSPTRSTDAYAQYLRGQDALSRQHYQSGANYARSADVQEALPFALQQFERAVEADPEFALAYAALSQVHIDHYWYGIDRSNERRQLALAAVQRAREIQPDLPEARLAMALYFYHGYHDYGAALQELDAVRDRLPSDANLYRIYAAIYRRMGRWDESVDNGVKSIELNPLHVETMWNQSATYMAMRRFDEARELIQKAISLAPDMDNLVELRGYIERFDAGDTKAGYEFAQLTPLSGTEVSDHFLWWHAFYNRDYTGALEVIDRNDRFDFPNEPFLYPRESMRALLYRLQGDQELARRHFESARVQIEEALDSGPEDRGTPNLRIVLGEALVGVGETRRGIEMTDRGLEGLSPSDDAYFSRFLQYEAIMRVFLVTDPFGRALPMLEEYLSAHGGGFTIEGLLPDPRLDPIRDDPRFLELVEKYRR